MPFLYGNHVLKAHLGRITEDTPEHQGVVVYSMSDMPLVCFSLWFEKVRGANACAGLWRNCTGYCRHPKTGSNIDYNISPGVRIFPLCSTHVLDQKKQ
jgi:hypothetical protein